MTDEERKTRRRRNERRRKMERRRKSQRLMASIAAAAMVLAVCVATGSITIGSGDEAVGKLEETPYYLAEQVIFDWEKTGDYYVGHMPTDVNEEPKAVLLSPDMTKVDDEYPEEYENELIEKALLEQGYLSDDVPLDYDTQDMTRTWCRKYEVPYTLVLAVIQQESAFKADAENGTCYGYMQINSINAEWLKEEIGVDDLEDPLQNLHSGIYMLSCLFGKYGDWDKALTCYNYGEAGAQKYVFSKGLTSTAYSRSVLALRSEWLEVVPDDCS